MKKPKRMQRNQVLFLFTLPILFDVLPVFRRTPFDGNEKTALQTGQEPAQIIIL